VGEAGVLKYMPDAVYSAPSSVFGPRMTSSTVCWYDAESALRSLRWVRINIVPAGLVDDVRPSAEAGGDGQGPGGYSYEGGPEVESFRGLMGSVVLGVVNRRRLVIALRKFVRGMIAFGLDCLQSVIFGLIKNNTLTRDQIQEPGP